MPTAPHGAQHTTHAAHCTPSASRANRTVTLRAVCSSHARTHSHNTPRAATRRASQPAAASHSLPARAPTAPHAGSPARRRLALASGSRADRTARVLRRRHRQEHPCRLTRQRRHYAHAPTTTTAILRLPTPVPRTSALPTQRGKQRAPRRRARGAGARFAAARGPPPTRLHLRTNFADALLGTGTEPSLHRHARRDVAHGDITPGSQVAAIRRAAPRLLRGPVRRCHERSARLLVADGGTFDVGCPPTSLRPDAP